MSENPRFRLSRRDLLRLAGLGTVSAASIYVDRRFHRGSKEPHPPIPEGFIDEFRIGKTTFAFGQEWQEDERRQIKSDLNKLYWPIVKIAGSEPVDISGRDTINVLITRRNFSQGTGASTIRYGQSSRVDLVFSGYSDMFLAHEFTEVCFGLNFGAHGRPAYRISFEGFRNAVANLLLNSIDAFKQYSRQTMFDPQLANKPQTAFYGYITPSIGAVRDVLSTIALTEALKIDPDFLHKLRDKYLEVYNSQQDPTDFYTIPNIRQALRESFAGDFNTLVDKHKILGEVILGKHIIIAGEYHDGYKQEVLSAFCFEYIDDGFNQSIWRNIPVNTQLVFNGTTAWEQQIQTDERGRAVLLKSEDLTKYKGNQFTFKVDAPDFGSDEVNFVA